MNTTPYSLLVGIDRSDANIDIAALSAGGRALHERKVSTDPEVLLEWVQQLRLQFPEGRIALCIEQPCANLAAFFGQFDFLDLYLVNPVLIKSYRESFHTARSKDDRKDAACIARFLFERRATMAPWKPAAVEVRQLRAFLEHRRLIVDQRTELTNRLTAALKLYYPQALTLSGKDLHAPLACRFLEKFPDLPTLKSARADTVRKFYHANKCRRAKLVEERIAAIAKAVVITEDPGIVEPQRELVLFLVSQLDLLRPQIKRYDEKTAAIMAAHDDAEIFESLPGAGPNLSSRLLATFGSDRERLPAPESVQRFSGIAPVTKQSGKKRHVHRRFTKCTCPHFEHQTFIEWTGQTITKSSWARAYYDQQKGRKMGHWAIIRSLAYKWIRILHRCWIEGETYDEEKYLEALERAGSPIAKLVHKDTATAA